MSADAPRDPSTTQPHHAEHVRRPEPDSGPRAEQAPPISGPMPTAQGSPNTLPAEPSTTRPGAPLPRWTGPAMPSEPGDGGNQGPAEAGARGAGSGTDRHAGQAELQREAGTGPRDRSPTETPSRAEHNEARHARPPIERAAAPPERRDDGYSWPPPQADRDSARALYREDFGTKTTADSARHGRDRGINVVGESLTSPRAIPAASALGSGPAGDGRQRRVAR